MKLTKNTQADRAKIAAIRSLALLSASATAMALFAQPAHAQDSTQPAEAETGAGTSIIVTGSRIRRPNLESAIPITSIGGEEIFEQGQNSVGDTLNDLPQLRSTFAQQNPGAGVGIAGLNLLDLRGLGTVRTLVLVNGRRHVAADMLNNASSPDVNTIPNDLIERVDIVTGGNSAVYGSDAIAGVVNFVLKRDFEGVQARGNVAMSEKGYGLNQYASMMYGTNFADGRGNITLHAEFANQERVYASDIPWLRQNNAFATVDADVGGLPQGSDGFPDAVFVQDIRSATTHRYGLVAIPQPQPAAGSTGLCGVGTLANNGPANTNGTVFNCNYIFDADGGLVPQTGTRFGTGPSGAMVGGNGQTSREGTQLSILPSNRRINTNVLAHYEFSDALELFFEGKFVQVDAIGNQLGPTFLNNTTSSLGNDARIDPRLDNPYLSSAARTLIANGYLANNCTYTRGTSIGSVTCANNTPGGGTPAQETTKATTLAARNAAIANGSYRFLFARNLTDSPDRDEIFRRRTYRFVVGARGGFFDDWNYEISANYGKQDERTDMRGFVDRQRFLLSLDAGRNPVTGAVQCRSQFDAASAGGAPGLSGSAADPAKLASDIAACMPYNPFGAGNNAAAVNYFKARIVNYDSLDQLDINGFIGGNTGKFFNLPGGPVSFVIGGEYRREKAINNSDDAADTGLSNAVFLGDVDAPAQTVKEAFGELNLPLVKDLPFLQDLTVSGAVRVSDYNTGAGTVWAYNAGVEWSPIDGVRFRGNYGRSVRAPNVSEAGFPSVKNFANNFIDPCNPNDVAKGTAARVTNCGSLSAAQVANLPLAGYSLGIVSGSNANLKAEEADSYTLGAVIQPRAVPGLSVTIDYYNIHVNNVIVSLTAQTIVNACYDSPGLSSPLCNVFQRNLGTTNGPNGELPGAILAYSLVSGPQNFAKRIRKGIDVEAVYRHRFNENLSLNTRIIYSHTFQNSDFENPSIPDTENINLLELGNPKDEYSFNADLTAGRLTFGYELHYVGPMLTSTYENFYNNNAGVTGQTGLPLNSDAFDIQKYPGVFYHDVRLNWKIRDRLKDEKELNVYFGIDNVTDRRPPLGSTGTGVGSSIYSIRGRNLYVGFKAGF
jgi:outer membrane receptor protein involved in Fe transport